jgi:CHAT domain
VEYEPLKIRLQSTGAGSYGVLASTATAEAASEFQLPFDERDFENFVLRVGRPRRGVRRLDSPEFDSAKGFGSALFDALFQGEVRDLYHAASAEADSAGKGLRITLLLGQAPELMHVPWEYLCEGGDFLSVSERTPIVRYLDLKKAHRPFRVDPPLRIVGMVSSPSDVIELNVEEEKRRLEHALGDLLARGLVEIVWLERATLRALLRTLEERDLHVFHYIGHGAFDKQAGDGVLMLEDDRGRGKPVTGMYLGQLLQDERTLQLVVLNACEGARTDPEDAFGGVAASLVKREIPSVVAMQFEITDDAAILFAEGFYSALARSSPVDAALAAARKEIWAAYNDIEWGTPVLFMRVPDGRIFDVPPRDSGELDRPPLDVRFLAEPEAVEAGDEVTWRLTITNVGKSPVYRINGLGSDGSTLVDETELRPGRRCATRWRTRPREDAATTVTVTANDSRGDRIAEQVNAHVRVRRAPDRAEPLDRSGTTEERQREEAAAAAAAKRRREAEEDRVRKEEEERLREAERRRAREEEERRKRLRKRVAAAAVLALLLAAVALVIGWLTRGEGSPGGGPAAGGMLDWQRAGDLDLGGRGDQAMTSIVDTPWGRMAQVAGGYDSSSEGFDAAIWSSSNGRAWRRMPAGEDLAGPGDQQIRSVAYVPGALLAAGTNTANGNHEAALWRSSDGADWEPVPGLSASGTDPVINRLTTGTSVGLVAAGWQTVDGEDGALWVSRDGRAWDRVDFGGPGEQRINRAREFGGKLVALGFADGDAGVWVSKDGRAWDPVSDADLGGDGDQEILDATSFGSTLAAVGVEEVNGDTRGAVWLSEDGRSWRRVPDQEGTFEGSSPVRLNRVFDPSPTLVSKGFPRLVAGGSVGDDAAVWTSKDGEDWVREPDPSGAFRGDGTQVIHSFRSSRRSLLAVGSYEAVNGLDAAVWIGTRPE